VTDQNPDREKLVDTFFVSLELPNTAADMPGDALLYLEHLADAILASDWLRARDERVRREAAAEQREKDYAAVQRGMPESGPHILGSERRAGIVEGVGRSLDAIREQGNE